MECLCAVRGKANTCPVVVKQEEKYLHAATIFIRIDQCLDLKILAFGDMFGSAPEMVNYILHEYADPWQPEHSRPVYSTMVRICNRARQTMRPSDPHDLSFELDEDFIA